MHAAMGWLTDTPTNSVSAALCVLLQILPPSAGCVVTWT